MNSSDTCPGDVWLPRGVDSDSTFTVRALAHIVAGQVVHHATILRERHPYACLADQRAGALQRWAVSRFDGTLPGPQAYRAFGEFGNHRRHPRVNVWLMTGAAGYLRQSFFRWRLGVTQRKLLATLGSPAPS